MLDNNQPKMTQRLTIVMPLKGRLLFTFRFLWHANKMRLPYRFLIADGGVNEAVARRLENSRKDFPELDIEYVRYPDDVDYSRFFAKMADAMQRVRTPYAMMADNDDFVGLDGTEKALDFLDANADYVCARGRTVDFSLSSAKFNSPGAISGKFNRLSLHGDSKDATAASAAGRLREAGLCHGLYSAIHRTSALTQIWREVAEIDFSDMMLHEDFHALRALTLGKAHTDKGSVSYYSQAGSGISYQPMRDWICHLLRSHFTSDAHAVIKRISAAAEADGGDASAITDDVRRIFERYYRNFLLAHYGSLARIKRSTRTRWPRLVNYLQTRPRFSVGRERQAILSQLQNAGGNQADIKRISGELAVIESALSPSTFAEFAKPFLPLGKDHSQEWLSISVLHNTIQPM
jgi:glycosyltransferase domain-containing protein